MSAKAHGIMFHHFHDDGAHIKSQGSVSKDQFRKMLSWLNENFNLLNASDWYNKAMNDNLKENDICITFDDNLKCQFDIALPVLEEFKLTAFWFIYSSPLVGVKERLELYRYFRFSEFDTIESFYEGFTKTINGSSYSTFVQKGLQAYDASTFLNHFPFYTEEDKQFRFVRDHILGEERYFELMDMMIAEAGMSIDEISKILWNNAEDINHLHHSGHIVGLHSHTHPTKMSMKDAKAQKEEYHKNHEVLNGILQADIITMSHPCNSYNKDTLSILDDLNIQLGFRANMEDGYHSNLEYPRLDHALLFDKI